MKRMVLGLVVGLVVGGSFGCGDDGGSSPLIDASPPGDGPLTVDAPGTVVDAPDLPDITLTISGVAQELTLAGRTPLAGVTIEAYARGSATPLGTTTSNVQGAFAITITSNGPLDGYLKGSVAGRLDTYLYPPAPLEGDMPNLAVLLVTQTLLNQARGLAQADQDEENGLIGVQVLNASSQPAAGVMVSSAPAGEVRYNSNGLPTNLANANATDTDGIAYIFNVPAGDATVSATGGGLTFPSHSVEVRPGVVTTTLIHP